jgi:hypothetical protein
VDIVLYEDGSALGCAHHRSVCERRKRGSYVALNAGDARERRGLRGVIPSIFRTTFLTHLAKVSRPGLPSDPVLLAERLPMASNAAGQPLDFQVGHSQATDVYEITGLYPPWSMEVITGKADLRRKMLHP